jgi:hypothetical protein
MSEVLADQRHHRLFNFGHRLYRWYRDEDDFLTLFARLTTPALPRIPENDAEQVSVERIARIRGRRIPLDRVPFFQ